MSAEPEQEPDSEKEPGRPLAGRVAVVCGASRGIGKGIALELGSAGAVVVAVGRRLRPGSAPFAGSLEATITEIRKAGGTAEAVAADVSSEGQVARLFEGVSTRHGRVDVVVNSAFDAPAFTASIGKPFWELPMSLWHEVVDVGTKSAYLTAVAAAPAMLDRHGLIVNISARGAGRYRYNVAYGVGKAALDRMTSDLAADLEPHKVAVVSLWPGTIRTESVDDDPDAARQRFGDIDIEAMETPRYVGRAVAALAADPAVMKRSGHRYWVAEIGADYDLVDENGRSHDVPEAMPS